MLLKITGKTIGESKAMIGNEKCIKVVDLDTGVDITRGIRKLTIDMQPGKIVTANLECLVVELDLSGVEGILKKI